MKTFKLLCRLILSVWVLIALTFLLTFVDLQQQEIAALHRGQNQMMAFDAGVVLWIKQHQSKVIQRREGRNVRLAKR